MRRSHLLTFSFAVVVSEAIALWIVRSNPGGLLRPCFFRALTGIPCPACGTTRSVRALFSGDLGASLGSNPLASGIAITLLAGAVAALVCLPWADRLRLPRLPSRRTLLWIGAILILANWGYLIAASCAATPR